MTDDAAVVEAAVQALAKGTPDEQKAFWINAYNLLAIRTVVADSAPAERVALINVQLVPLDGRGVSP